MKVLHMPLPMCGHTLALAQAEQKLGVDSHVLYRNNNWLGAPEEMVLDRTGKVPLIMIKGFFKAMSIRKEYDVLHFNFGTTLIDFPEYGVNHWDLPLYNKQKLFVTYNGTDARQGVDWYGRPEKARREDENKARRIERMQRAGATFFALNPDLMRYLPKETTFLPYVIENLNEIEPADILQNGRKLKIVHAPTNRIVKGTASVIDAVSRLQEKYPGRIELSLVERVPHSEAMRLYRKADIIIDQLRVGWFGAFAVEAMKLGKPVIVYINHEDLKFIPKQMARDCLETVIEADGESLYSVLEGLLEQPEMLKARREAGFEFVNRWYDPLETARVTKAAYERAMSL